MHQVLPSAVGARYRRETEHADSVAATVKTYYLNTGKLASQQGFANLRKGVPNGVSEWWYPSGQLQMHEQYVHGRRVGELRTYYPSGQLKRTTPRMISLPLANALPKTVRLFPSSSLSRCPCTPRATAAAG